MYWKNNSLKQVLLGFQLWNLLHTPPDNELYLYTTHQYFNRVAHRANQLIPLAYALAIFGGVGLLLGFFALVSIVIGGIWANTIAGYISHKQAVQIKDFLGTTPSGILGSYLIISIGLLHQNQNFRSISNTQVNSVRLISAVVTNMVLVLFMTSALNVYPPVPVIVFLLVFIMSSAILTALFYALHVYSILVGVLTGMTMASFDFTRVIAQTGATVIYSVWQVFVLLLSLIVIGVGSGWLFTPIVIVRLAILEAALLLLFCMVGEISVRILWRTLSHRLNAESEATIILAGNL